jgi:hypothetical protein
MAEAILTRLAACQSLLGALKGRPNFERVSSSERLKVHSLLLQSRLGTEDLAEVATAVGLARFASCDEQVLVDAIGDAATSESVVHAVGTGSRTSQQNFEALVHFLPEGVWSLLKDGSVEAMVEHLIKIGLRNPSEPTFMTMTLSMLFQSEGLGKVIEMSSDGKLVVLKSIKNLFKSKCKLAVQPVQWVQCLPKSPDSFRTQFSALYASAFKSCVAHASPISELGMEQMRVGAKMRKTKGSVMNLGSLQQPDMPSQMLAFGQGLMSQMALMQSEIAGLRSNPSVSSASGLASRLSLLDKRGPRQEPLLQLEAPAIGALQLTSAAPAVPAIEERAGVVAVAADEEQAAVDRQHLVLSVADATAEIRRAIAKRKSEEESAEPAQPKAKAKAKGKSKAKAKAKAKAKGKSKGKDSGSDAQVDISHERSRNQYLCRTGLKEHPSKTFKYGGSNCSEKAALTHAKALDSSLNPAMATTTMTTTTTTTTTTISTTTTTTTTTMMPTTTTTTTTKTTTTTTTKTTMTTTTMASCLQAWCVNLCKKLHIQVPEKIVSL